MERELKNSIEYISKKTGKNSGFSTPVDYFNNLEDAIHGKLSEDSFAKKAAFNVPDYYFNKLEDNILSKVIEKKTKVISFKEKVLKMIPYAAAASIILFIGLNSFVFNSSEELTIDSLSDNDVAYWLDANTLNANDVTLLLQEEILEENDFSFATIKDENIEDYINSIDNTDLLNEIN
jgi:hypothetical protein